VRHKLLRIAVRLVGPLLLLVVLLRMDNRAQLWAVFKRADVLVLIGAALLNALNIQLKVIRWQVLLATRGFRYSTAAAWRAVLPSMYISMLTPGRVGDVLRVQYIRRDIDVPYAEGLAIIVMDRLCDVYVLLGFVVAGVAHYASVMRGDLGWITWAAVATIAAVPLLLLVKGPVDRVLEAVYARVSKNAQRGPEGARAFLEALRAQLGRRLLLTVPLTVGAFLVHYLQGWLAARALGLNLSFVDVMFMLAITSLLSLLPISMSGVGVRELFMALVFPTLGFTAQQGVAFGLVVFAVVYLATMCAGFVAWQLYPPPIADDEAARAPPRQRPADPPSSDEG